MAGWPISGELAFPSRPLLSHCLQYLLRNYWMGKGGREKDVRNEVKKEVRNEGRKEEEGKEVEGRWERGR